MVLILNSFAGLLRQKAGSSCCQLTLKEDEEEVQGVQGATSCCCADACTLKYWWSYQKLDGIFTFKDKQQNNTSFFFFLSDMFSFYCWPALGRLKLNTVPQCSSPMSGNAATNLIGLF